MSWRATLAVLVSLLCAPAWAQAPGQASPNTIYSGPPSGSAKGLPSFRAPVTKDLLGIQGSSVADPGNNKLEMLLPVQTNKANGSACAGSCVFTATDFFHLTRRSNAGSAMTDTLPSSAAVGLTTGTRISIKNVDGTATDTISAGSGTTIEGNPSYSLVASLQVDLAYDASASTWRVVSNNPSASVPFPIALTSIAALRANTTPWPAVTVTGWYTGSSNGSGDFLYVSTDTTSADNKCTIIVDANNHRYYRQLTGPLDFFMCGAKGDATVDDTTAIQAALNVTAAAGVGGIPGGEVRWPAGNFCIPGGINIPANVNVIGTGEDSSNLNACNTVLGGGNTAPIVNMNGPFGRIAWGTIYGYYGLDAAWATLDVGPLCGCFVDHIKVNYGLGITSSGSEAFFYHVVPDNTFATSQFYCGANFSYWNAATKTAHVAYGINAICGGFANGLFNDHAGQAGSGSPNTTLYNSTIPNWAAGTPYVLGDIVNCCAPDYKWWLIASQAGTSGGTHPTPLPYGQDICDPACTPGNAIWRLQSANGLNAAVFDGGTNQFYIDEADFTGMFNTSILIENNLFWGPTTNAITAAGNATLHFASVPDYVVAGLTIIDATTGAAIPAGTTVVSKTATTVVMSQNAAGGGVGNGDTIHFYMPAPHDILCSYCTISPYLGNGVALSSGNSVYIHGDGQLSGGPLSGSVAVLTASDFTGLLEVTGGQIFSGCAGGLSLDAGSSLKVHDIGIKQVWGGACVAPSTGILVANVTNVNISNVSVVGLQAGASIAGTADYVDVSHNDFSQVVLTSLSYTASGTHNNVTDNKGFNPVGVTNGAYGTATTVTHPGVPYKTTHYLTGGTVTSVRIPNNAGTEVCPGTPCFLNLDPNETFSVTYTVAPTDTVSTH